MGRPSAADHRDQVVPQQPERTEWKETWDERKEGAIWSARLDPMDKRNKRRNRERGNRPTSVCSWASLLYSQRTDAAGGNQRKREVGGGVEGLSWNTCLHLTPSPYFLLELLPLTISVNQPGLLPRRSCSEDPTELTGIQLPSHGGALQPGRGPPDQPPSQQWTRLLLNASLSGISAI